MTIKQFLCVVILAVMLNWILPLACASADPTDSGKSTRDSPNVILMMADDIGYNDLSAYGSKKIRTPVLDKLAADGIKLTSFYAGAAVCTPSRMALLSGAYPARIGWKGGVVGASHRSVARHVELGIYDCRSVRRGRLSNCDRWQVAHWSW